VATPFATPRLPERVQVSTQPKKNNDDKQVLGFLGVGLDNKDGHERVTRNEDFLLVGGSEETHEHLQDVSIRFNESLRQRDKRLQDAEVEEVLDLLRKAMDR
jgi:hypothetical protein